MDKLLAYSDVLLRLLKSLHLPKNQESQEVGLYHVVEVAPSIVVSAVGFDAGEDSKLQMDNK